MKDYLVQVRVKNGPFMALLRERGMSGADLSRLCGVQKSTIYEYLNLRLVPITSSGKWRKSILEIADALGVEPECLFPPQHYEKALEKNTAELEMSLPEVQALCSSPEENLIRQQLIERVLEVVDTLPERERLVLRMRLGIDGEALKFNQIDKRLGLKRGRSGLAYDRAIRKLQRPSKQAQLRGY